jgi:aldose 1-epimerase
MAVQLIHHKTQGEVERLGYKGFEKVGGIFQFIAPNGVEIHKTPYGAATLAVFVPNLKGERKNIVAGFPELSQYEADNTFQGRIVLHANRVRDYQAPGVDRKSNLVYNEAARNCHLHGGPNGANQVWTPESIINPYSDADPYIVMSWIQPDGYNGRDSSFGNYGHPGPVITRLVMRLGEEGTFMQRFVTVSEKTTFRSNTDHIYMMPAGVDSNKSVAEMALYNNCTHHIVVDKDLMPTGDKLEAIVKGSAD